jgi:gluconokinase
MGVSGCGKTEIGRRLAECLNAAFIEGDAYHSGASIDKMRAGIPLDDDDRRAWLLRLQERVRLACRSGESAVLACSALKRRYRDVLREGDPDLTFVHLDGERTVLAARMQARAGHYMPTALLDSQISDLDPLQADENGARFDVATAPGQLVRQILARLA